MFDNYNQPKIQKNNGFTAIRIICAFIVVYEHFVVLTNMQLPLLNLRDFAVNTFFILSGFWVTKSFLSSKTIIEYFKKRIRKIFPLYLLVVFLSAILLSFFSALSFYDYFLNNIFWKYLLMNIITLNFIQPYLPGVFDNSPVNGSLWTIKVEIGFYIILPLLIYIWSKKWERSDGEKKSYNWGLLIILYVISVIYVILIDFIIKQYNLPEALNHQLPAYISYFISGMICFLYYNKIYPVINYLIFPSCIILILTVFNNIFLVNIFTIVFEPIALSIFIMFLALKIKIFQVFSKVYDFSYPLYLFHYPLIMILKLYIGK